MAHYYKLPFFCIAGTTDSKVLDAQAGLEYCLLIFNATLNGSNIIHDCGYLEYGSKSSFESVLFADEIINMTKYMLKPLKFDDKTVPIEVMAKLGPGSNFLMEDHTLEYFKKTFWFPRFLDRNGCDLWKKNGSKELRQILNEKARDIFENNSPARLPEEKITKIKEIISRHKPDIRR